MFSDEFFANALVCFTRFASNKKSQALRKKGKELDKAELILQMQDEFKNRFNCDLKADQFAFIDNTVTDMDDDEKEDGEQVEFDKALD